jgi:hypothetical protein
MIQHYRSQVPIHYLSTLRFSDTKLLGTNHVSQDHNGTPLSTLTETTCGLSSSLRSQTKVELEECGNDEHVLAGVHTETDKLHGPLEVCEEDHMGEPHHR